MCHIFIHSSVDGHLGCFHVLAIVNSAAPPLLWIVCFYRKAYFIVYLAVVAGVKAQAQFRGQLQQPVWHPQSPGRGMVKVLKSDIQESHSGKGKVKSEHKNKDWGTS